MNLRSLAISLILCLSVLGTAAAASPALAVNVVTHDTDVQSTSSNLKVCSCGTTIDTFRVKNIGQLAAVFYFELQSDQPWFTLDKRGDYLAPGQEVDELIYIHAPCGAVGTATYTMYVASEYGRYRAITKTVQTGVCQSILADLTPQTVTVQPCASQPFTLSLSNVATFRDTFDVSSGPLGFGSPKLDAGENAALQGAYTASCSEWGTKTIPVTIHAEQGNLDVTKYVTITVPRAYNFNVDIANVQLPVCVGVTNAIPVTITNTEARQNTVVLTNPDGSNQSVIVGANTQVQTTVPFSPTQTGPRQVNVRGVGVNGGITKTSAVTVPVDACYGLTVEAPAESNSCPGPLQIPFTITSSGSLTQQVDYDVRSNATTHVDSLQGILRPGETVQKTVTVDVPDKDSQSYLTLVANASHAGSQATTTVNSYSTETCYSVAPTSHEFRVWTDQIMLPVVIKQTGVQPGLYDVSYDGAILEPVEQQLSISPGGEVVLHFSLNSTGYKPGRYVGRLTLATKGVNYVTDFSVTLREKGFWEHFLDQVRWDGAFALCSVVSVLALLILIAVIILCLGVALGFVEYENPSWLSRQTLAIVGCLVLIVLLVLMIVNAPTVPRSYVRPLAPSNESALFFETGQSQPFTINLHQFFADPDNDTLTFTSNQPQHVQVRIDGYTATVKPNSGFAGEDTLVFTASDHRGGVTDSDVITVSVVPFKPVTLLQCWSTGCWFYTFLFLFIAAALALLTMLFVRDLKQTPVHQKRSSQLVLYHKAHSQVPATRGVATELIEHADTRIRNLPPGTSLGQVVGTQVNAQNVIVGDAQDQLWVASAGGTKFHRITCPVIKGMPRDKRVTFSTRDEAIKAGYTPCKTCSSHE